MAHTLLVVDDDQYIRELYEEVLIDAGYDVATAVDGKDGVIKMTEKVFDLVLLDIMMPKMDGIEVMRHISKMEQKPKAVVLLTNLAHDPVMKESKALGARDYLIKADLTPDQLVDKIKTYL